ncbi:hypothetical protein B0H13DRAFT_1575332, partial [Mycena leptocephala]
HYVWYARFTEKGDGSPDNVHPTDVRRDHGGKVNFTGRFPRQAQELRESHEEYALLAHAFGDFFDLIRVALKTYLGQEYDEIKMLAEALPLGASSPAYPFAGFVLNVGACTWAHRDQDKLACFVIPMGDYEGGQLALYETGFSFNLQMGEVLAFPSCDMTHFNLHFTGRRAYF